MHRYRVKVLRTALVEVEILVNADSKLDAQRLGSAMADMVSVDSHGSFKVLEHRALPDSTIFATREIT